MEQPWKVVLAFLGVFIAGALFGGVFTLRVSGKRWTPPQAIQHATPAPAPARPAAGTAGKAPQPLSVNVAFMRQITQRIQLTPDQREHVTRIVNRAGDDLRRLQREHITDTTRVTQRMYSDVAAILSPEQREELELVRQQVEERLKKAREKVPAPDPARQTQGQKASKTREPGSPIGP
jgi:hypothetical protein